MAIQARLKPANCPVTPLQQANRTTPRSKRSCAPCTDVKHTLLPTWLWTPTTARLTKTWSPWEYPWHKTSRQESWRDVSRTLSWLTWSLLPSQTRSNSASSSLAIKRKKLMRFGPKFATCSRTKCKQKMDKDLRILANQKCRSKKLSIKNSADELLKEAKVKMIDNRARKAQQMNIYIFKQR